MITTSFYRLQLFHKVTDSFEDDLHKETYYQFKQLAILEYLKEKVFKYIKLVKLNLFQLLYSTIIYRFRNKFGMT